MLRKAYIKRQRTTGVNIRLQIDSFQIWNLRDLLDTLILFSYVYELLHRVL